MLILTRKSDERILIGNGIELVVLSVEGSRVRLGIQAPAELSITRTSNSPKFMPVEFPAESSVPDHCSL